MWWGEVQRVLSSKIRLRNLHTGKCKEAKGPKRSPKGLEYYKNY